MEAGRDMYGGRERYSGTHFSFHSKSEHTVDGKRMDLEMETFHLSHSPQSGDVKYAVTSFLFSAAEFT